MPTIWEHGPYRFFFYSADGSEPPHVHVERERNKAKFWLTQFDCKIAADTAAMKSIVSKD